jgi:hypothetical protein
MGRPPWNITHGSLFASSPPPFPHPSLSPQGAIASRRCRLLHPFYPMPLDLANPPFPAVINVHPGGHDQLKAEEVPRKPPSIDALWT